MSSNEYRKNSSQQLLIGILAGVAICGIVVLIFFLVGQNKRLAKQNKILKKGYHEMVEDRSRNNSQDQQLSEEARPASEAAPARPQEPSPQTAETPRQSEPREQTRQKPAVEEPAPSYDTPFRSGRNILNGTFYYNGYTSNFTIRFNYNSRTNRVSDAVYVAEGYDNEKQLSMTISDDGTRISFSGMNTSISASLANGTNTYSGDMSRVDHYGSCQMTLN